MKPALCPLCLQAGKIATVNGPTCTHAAPFFPPWWNEQDAESRRIAYLEQLNMPKQASLSKN